MSKRYRLLKDLPDSVVGDIYVWRGGGTTYQEAYYKDNDYTKSLWTIEYVEDNPTWFEEIKEKERTEVRDMLFVSSPNSKVWHYNVCMNDEIREEKFPLIKKAIEKVLNDEQPKEETWLSQYTKEHEQKLREDAIKLFATPPFSGEFITKEECERRESMAFDSARKLWADEFQPPKVQLFYETFEAYKTINPF